MTVAGERSPCPYPDLRGFFTSSPSALLRRGNERAAGWVLVDSQRKATTAIKKIFFKSQTYSTEGWGWGHLRGASSQCWCRRQAGKWSSDCSYRVLEVWAGSRPAQLSCLFVSFPPQWSRTSCQPFMSKFQPRHGLPQLPHGQ